ncbi:MAG TPA: phospholipase D-like domain-containing protein, partial [Candidatus Binatia bacterium]|nr:phospholipase D-like domain-containing protein [Candidatus Binatia bacterium]
MRIPYVIDNIEHTLAQVLNQLLSERDGQRLDVATAYFSVRGFQQLRETLPNLRGFRLLLGDEPQEGGDVGVHPDAKPSPAPGQFLRLELNAAPLQEQTAQLVEELIRFLRRDDVQVRLYLGHDPQDRARRRFLHAKCYLLWEADPSLQSPVSNLQSPVSSPQSPIPNLYPLVAIVGSSNFTGPGLTSNRELNLVHKTLLSEEEVVDEEARQKVARRLQKAVPIDADREEQRALKSEVGDRAIGEVSQWYEAQWAQALDYKAQLIEILENSKFGGREYTPYEIYLKALYEYFRDDLDADFDHPATRSAVELTEFQEDAVKKARRILARYDGVLIADSVGLGKTWIGKKLLEDTAYHQRQKALVICPASLRDMWREELQGATIAARIISQEKLGMGEVELHGLHDVDVILVDEAHNFRNRRTNRYEMLETILAANGRRGRSGGRKKVIL